LNEKKDFKHALRARAILFEAAKQKTMDWKELLTNNKFRWLLASLLVVVPFELLSFFSIHFPLSHSNERS